MLLDPAKGYRTGTVLAHGFGPDPDQPRFTLLEGDITAAYGDKVRQVQRSFVFLNLRNAGTPSALIVCDRVVAADPAYRKYWLLHSQVEPQLGPTGAVIECTQHGDRGRLTLDVLLPAADNLVLSKVGGPGKEFWVFGTNYANDVPRQTLERSSMEPGAWRVEASPKNSSAEDLFLNVMQLTDARSSTRLTVERIADGPRVGCRLRDGNSGWHVLFARSGAREEEQTSLEGKGGYYLILGLNSGLWKISREGDASVREISVPDDSHALWFEGPSGKWTAQRVAPSSQTSKQGASNAVPQE